MEFFKQNWVSILAVVALLLAVPDGLWPYAYYQMLRWGITAAAIYIGYRAFEMDQMGWMWVMGIAAVVFNPILPVYLDKSMWVIIDLIAAVVFTASIFFFKKNHHG